MDLVPPAGTVATFSPLYPSTHHHTPSHTTPPLSFVSYTLSYAPSPFFPPFHTRPPLHRKGRHFHRYHRYTAPAHPENATATTPTPTPTTLPPATPRHTPPSPPSSSRAPAPAPQLRTRPSLCTPPGPHRTTTGVCIAHRTAAVGHTNPARQHRRRHAPQNPPRTNPPFCPQGQQPCCPMRTGKLFAATRLHLK